MLSTSVMTTALSIFEAISTTENTGLASDKVIEFASDVLDPLVEFGSNIIANIDQASDKYTALGKVWTGAENVIRGATT